MLHCLSPAAERIRETIESEYGETLSIAEEDSEWKRNRVGEARKTESPAQACGRSFLRYLGGMQGVGPEFRERQNSFTKAVGVPREHTHVLSYLRYLSGVRTCDSEHSFTKEEEGWSERTRLCNILFEIAQRDKDMGWEFETLWVVGTMLKWE